MNAGGIMCKMLAALIAAQCLLTACDQSAPPKPPKPVAEHIS
jgi:hypothetical protein